MRCIRDVDNQLYVELILKAMLVQRLIAFRRESEDMILSCLFLTFNDVKKLRNISLQDKTLFMFDSERKQDKTKITVRQSEVIQFS